MGKRRPVLKSLLTAVFIVGAMASGFVSFDAMAQRTLSEHGFALGSLKLRTPSGELISLVVEVAATSSERAKGLMYRTALTDSEGMVFIWQDNAVRQFWMKNTPLSLDILFFDSDGVLVHEALAQTPYSQSLISSLLPVRTVLEVPAGTASASGIEIGTQITQLPSY